jgi:hypothetical protein
MQLMGHMVPSNNQTQKPKISFTPLLVATQIVSGANYIYICNVVVPNAPPFPAEVIIFKPLKGPPHVVSIKRFS